MFASSIQIVTLIAFTAHAVLGCCWHHSHASLDLTTQTAEAQLSGCSTAIAHNGCGHQRTAKSCDASEGSSGQHVKRGCCSSSHQPFGHCTSGRCSYISAKVLTLNLSAGASLEGFVSTCDLQRQLPSVTAKRHIGHQLFFSSPQSPGERCVYLQTWQI
jgi:hypothetical protein